MKRLELTRGFTALVDDEDYASLSRYSWYTVNGRGCFYAGRLEGGRLLLMHRVILDAPADRQVDHVHRHDLLKIIDNRRENLRLATPSQNQMNRRKPRGEYSSRFKGVYWERDRRRYRAAIRLNGKSLRLGRYRHEEDAAKAYDVKAVELFGEFAATNFPVSESCEGRMEGSDG